jgi:hypothetical protein
MGVDAFRKCRKVRVIRSFRSGRNPQTFGLLWHTLTDSMVQPPRTSSDVIREERVVIRVSSDLRKQIEALALSNERSLSGEIRLAMIRWIQLQEADAA